MYCIHFFFRLYSKNMPTCYECSSRCQQRIQIPFYYYSIHNILHSNYLYTVLDTVQQCGNPSTWKQVVQGSATMSIATNRFKTSYDGLFQGDLQNTQVIIIIHKSSYLHYYIGSKFPCNLCVDMSAYVTTILYAWTYTFSCCTSPRSTIGGL